MVDVALTPAHLRAAPVIVVIDVLRATSTVTQALTAGYSRVLCCDSHARALLLRRPGRLVAGERGCIAPAGFDEGNSPSAFAIRRADDVALATTNGTPLMVEAAALGERVLLACPANIAAVAAAVEGEDVLVACAGTAGEPAVEDAYAAGLLAARLGACGDGARIARALAVAHPDPVAAVGAGQGAANLRNAGLGADIEACARLDTTTCVPELALVRTGVVAATLGSPRAGVADRHANRSISVYVSQQKMHLNSNARRGSLPHR